MDGRLDTGPKLRTPVENARDAAFVLALLFSPAARAEEQHPESVAAISGVDFSHTRGLNLTTPGRQFDVPPPPDPNAYVPTERGYIQPMYLQMMPGPNDIGPNTRFRRPRNNERVDLDDSSVFDRPPKGTEWAFEGRRAILRIRR